MESNTLDCIPHHRHLCTDGLNLMIEELMYSVPLVISCCQISLGVFSIVSFMQVLSIRAFAFIPLLLTMNCLSNTRGWMHQLSTLNKHYLVYLVTNTNERTEDSSCLNDKLNKKL